MATCRISLVSRSRDQGDLGGQLYVDHQAQSVINLVELGRTLGTERLLELWPIVTPDIDRFALNVNHSLRQLLGRRIVHRVQVLRIILDHIQPLVAQRLLIFRKVAIDRPKR